jgi:dipeptidyl aminopeptidase/acylaminoacyl peptidase
VLLTGARENDVGGALYRVALPGGEIKRVLGFDGTGIGDVVNDFFQPDVAGVTGRGQDPQRLWLEPEGRTARLYEGLHKAFPQQTVEVTSVTDSAHRAIVRVASDTNAGDFYFFNIDTKTIDPLQAARPWSDPAKMRPAEAVTFKARDGLELQGYVTRPSGNGPHPLVLIVNPSPKGYFAWEFDWQAQLFASRGYAVLEVNPRGSRSDRELERVGAGEWGRGIQDDLADATRWAIDRSIAQSGHVCIFGSQYGGYAALTGAVRDPKLYACAIGQFGVYDLESIPDDLTFSLGGTDYLKTMLGSDRKEWRARSPAANAEKIEAAVLLIHTDADDSPNFKQAKRMKGALDDAHKPYESLELKGKDLNALEEETRRTAYERIVDFLDRKIGSGSTPSP